MDHIDEFDDYVGGDNINDNGGDIPLMETTIYIPADVNDYYDINNNAGNNNVGQSFIFGAAHLINENTNQRTVNINNNRNVKYNSNNNNNTEGKEIVDLARRTVTTTNWAKLVKHWALASILLPLYALAIVTHAWKTMPETLSKSRGTLALVGSVVICGGLWTCIALYIVYPVVRFVFPFQHLGFLIYMYVICNFAEALMKNTTIIPSNNNNNSSTNSSGSANASYVTITSVVTGKELNVNDVVDRFLFLAKPSDKLQNTPLIAGLLTSALTTISFIVLGILVVLWPKISTVTIVQDRVILSAYVIIHSLVLNILCGMVYHSLGQVALRLYVRSKVVMLFSDAVAFHNADHCFRLTNLKNIKGWKKIRDTLLQRYNFPSLYVDVVISAAFTMWVPLVILGIVDFFLRSSGTTGSSSSSNILGISVVTVYTTITALFLLLYLIVCTMLATRVQECMTDTDVIRAQEFDLLLQQHNDNNKNGNGKDEKDNEGSSETTIEVQNVLRRFADLIDASKDKTVILEVWGFPLNRRMATLLGGVFITLTSSALLQAAAKLTTMVS